MAQKIMRNILHIAKTLFLNVQNAFYSFVNLLLGLYSIIVAAFAYVRKTLLECSEIIIMSV